MQSTQRQSLLITLLGVAVSIGFVVVAFHHLDLSSVVATWKSAQPLPWIPLAIGSYIAGHIVRGQRLRYLVRRDSRLPLLTASNVVVVGYASNNVLPARLGEFVRAGMLAERTGIPLAQAVTVTFVERLLDGLGILLLLVLGTLRRELVGWIQQLVHVGLAVFGGALAGLVVAVVIPRTLLSVATRLARPLSVRWRDRVLGVVTSMLTAGRCLRDPKDALTIGALSIVVWVLESLMFVAVLPALGLPAHLGTGIIAMSVTNLGILVPSTPGFVGPFHFFCSEALIAQGVAPAVALTHAVLVHLAFFIPVTTWGVGAMLWYGVQVGATAALARTARRTPRSRSVQGVPLHVIARLEPDLPRGEPSHFDVALTEALLPEDSGAQEQTLRDIAGFLSAEIASLPARLRSLYLAGMGVFRFYVRIRCARGFCNLPIAERRRIATSWAYGRFGLLRMLFRPVRSIVLLAFYERPESVGSQLPHERSEPSPDPEGRAAHG